MLNRKFHLSLRLVFVLKAVIFNVTSVKTNKLLNNGDSFIKPDQNSICEEDSRLLLRPLLVKRVKDVPELKPEAREFKEWYGPNDDNGHKVVRKGGSSQPKDCKTRWPKVAIIVAYLDRAPQLNAFR